MRGRGRPCIFELPVATKLRLTFVFRPFLRQQAAAEVPQNKTGARYRMLLEVLSCGK